MDQKPLCVLIVDDCKDAANSMFMLVEMWHHDVRVAYDGAAAREMAITFQPDVLLLDIAMPKIDGFTLARELRRQAPLRDALLVAMTGYADEVHRLLWENAFDHFLIKPVEPAIVERLLLLEQRRLANLAAASFATPRAVGILLAADEAAATSLGETMVETEYGSTRHVITAA